MSEQHHIFHLTTKFSAGTLLSGLLIGSCVVAGLAIGYHGYQQLNNRMAALETEVYQYRKHAWLVKVVEEKLKNQKAQIRSDVAETIYTQSKAKGIPVEYILGIIEVESNWDLTASNGAAMGAMQIDPHEAALEVVPSKTALQNGALYNPVTNIIAGSSHLSRLHKEYVKTKVERDTEFDPSLCAYNSGRVINPKNKQITNYSYALKVKAIALSYEALFKTPI